MALRINQRSMGTCISFNGTTSLISIAQTSGVPISADPTASFSISFWVNPSFMDTNGQCVYVECNDTLSASLFFIRVRLGTNNRRVIGIFYRNSANTILINNIDTNSEIPFNEWSFVSFTFNNGTVKVYVNGLEDGNSSANLFNFTPSGALANINRVTIGCVRKTWSGGNANFFKGLLDELSMLSNSLSAANAKILYQIGLSTITNSKKAVYLFDEGSGSTATDSSGNGNTGTLTAATYSTLVALGVRVATSKRIMPHNMLGDTLLLNGTSGNGQFPAANQINFTSTYTLSAWIRPQSLGEGSNGMIFNKAKFALYIGANNTLICSNGGSVITSNNNAIKLGSWQHVAVVYDDNANTVQFYVNGVTFGAPQTQNTNPVANTSDPLYIGNNAGDTNTFNGSITEPFMFNYALNANECSILYVKGTAYFTSTMVTGLVCACVAFTGSPSIYLDLSSYGATGSITSASVTTDYPISPRIAIN